MKDRRIAVLMALLLGALWFSYGRWLTDQQTQEGLSAGAVSSEINWNPATALVDEGEGLLEQWGGTRREVEFQNEIQGPPTGGEPIRFVLRGTILDEFNGWPLPDCTVEVERASQSLGKWKTDQSGRFRADWSILGKDALPTQSAESMSRVTLSIRGKHVVGTITREVKCSGEEGAGEWLVPGVAVVRGVFRQPVKETLYGPTLLLGSDWKNGFRSGTHIAALGADGHFEFSIPIEKIPDPAHLVLASETGIPEIRSIQIDGVRTDLGVIQQVSGFEIRGTVESQFPKELRSVEVTATEVGAGSHALPLRANLALVENQLVQRSLRGRVEKDGTFRITGLRPAQYRVEVQPPCSPLLLSKEIRDQHSVVVEARPNTAPLRLREWWGLVLVDVTLPPGMLGPQALRVVPTPTNPRLAANDWLYLPRKGSASPSGLAVAPGESSVGTVEGAPGFKAAELAVPALAEGQSLRIPLAMESDAHPRRDLRFSFQDSEGKPWGGEVFVTAEFYWLDESHWKSLHPVGRKHGATYEVADLPEGAYQVAWIARSTTVQRTEWVPAFFEFKLDASTPDPIPVTFQRGGWIQVEVERSGESAHEGLWSWEVLLPNGEPVAHRLVPTQTGLPVQLENRYQDVHRSGIPSGPQEALLPGEYLVQVTSRMNPRQQVSSTVQVMPGVTQTVRLYLPGN